MVTALLMIASTGSASAAEPARYHGGEVQHNPHLYAIFWGSSWTEGSNATQRAETEEFFKTVSGSSWAGILTQYFDENGAISSSVGFTSFLDKSVSSPTNVTPATIEEKFANVVAANGWPHTNEDQFMVFLPAGTTYGAGMSGFCGLHTVVHENELPGTGLQGVAWSIIKGTCALPWIASHEFAETVTDRHPEQQAWSRSIAQSGDDEIADDCTSGKLANGISVTKLWDNHLHECALADLNPPRLYAATNAATGITYQGGTLNGEINPAGRSSTYRFEYGTSTAYGSSAPVSEVNVGSGWKTLKVEAPIVGLKPETTYHYRITASNSSGQNTGEDLMFVTHNEHAPENTALPQVAPSTPNRAAPATVSTGSWTNAPTSYTYQWESCAPSGEGCSQISVGTGSSYTPSPQMVGRRLRVVVTATNAYGEQTATSNLSEPVREIGDITEYALSQYKSPGDLVAGPDGSTWFTEAGRIAKISPAGAITEYSGPMSPSAIALGPDGNIWFTNLWEGGRIGKITPLGVITEYSLPQFGQPQGIVAGPDGNMWFTTMSQRVGKITTAGTITEYSALASGLHSSGIAKGPDGNLWVTDATVKGNLWKVSTAGVGTEVPFPATSPAYDVTAGPDGNIWFTLGSPAAIGKVVPGTGTVSEYAVTDPLASIVNGIATGGDGNLWFTSYRKIGRIKPTGAITMYSLPNGYFPQQITAGTDGRMWTSVNEEFPKIAAIAP